MTDVVTTTAGFFPDPPTAQTDATISLQQELGFDRIIAHQVNWTHGLLEPLALHSSCNTAEKQYPGRITVDTEFTETGLLDDNVPLASDTRMLCIPDPYTLLDCCAGSYFATETECLAAITDYLYREVAQAPPHATLMMVSPAIVDNPPSDGMDERCSNAIDRIASASSNEVIFAGFGDGYTDKVHAHLLDARIDALGYDMITSKETSRELITEYGSTADIALGVVDATTGIGKATSVLQEGISSFINGFGVQEFTTVYAMPAGPLDTLPWKALTPLLSPLSALRTV